MKNRDFIVILILCTIVFGSLNLISASDLSDFNDTKLSQELDNELISIYSDDLNLNQNSDGDLINDIIDCPISVDDS